MASIKAKDRLDGSSNFNNWKASVTKILEENNIDHYMTSVVEDPSNNAGRTTIQEE